MAGSYQQMYIKREDSFVSLSQDTTDFCEKYIHPVMAENWDWGKRDFNKEKNEPTIEEARAIRAILYKDLDKSEDTEVDLSTIENRKALLAFFDPQSPHEAFNMDEFAFALKVELEHGRIRDANVTNNHPFLTAMIVLAHMSESITYYKRLQVMETESEIFELNRKLEDKSFFKAGIEKEIEEAEENLIKYKSALQRRLETMKDFPVLEKIGD